MKMRVILVTLEFLLSMCFVKGNLWSYILNNPVPESELGMKSFGLGERVSGDEHNDTALEEDLQPPLLRCHDDESCGDDMFCDQHYGYCDIFRGTGEPCRRDIQCQHALVCLFGKCQKPAKRGHKGSRCTGDADCKRNLCCARQHGERVCRSKLQRGHKCYVPDGGLEYSLNELCPCEAGLVCKKADKAKKPKDELEWRFWSAFESMRCAPINN